MKILMLTPYLPYPPVGGGQTRSYNLIKYLGKKHQITLFSLIKDSSEKKYVSEMNKYCTKVKVFQRPQKPWTLKNILRTGFSSYPFLVVRNFTEGVKEEVEKELKNVNYDLIHAENFYVMPYIPKTHIPTVLTEQTIFYKVYQHYVETLPGIKKILKPLLYIDVYKLKNWEMHYWKQANYISAVSEDDRKLITKLSGREQVYIIPNGVDYAQYSKKVYKRSTKPLILFGNADFHWMQNKEGAQILLDEIWPIINKKMPEARLWITGKIAPKVLSEYLKHPSIKIEEISVDKSREPYQKSWILIAPMKSGGGSRTKLFEAMASGLAIVATTQGVEGIGVTNNKEALVSDDYERLANYAIKILKDKKLRENLGENARNLVKRKYAWENSARELDRMYKEVTKYAKKV